MSELVTIAEQKGQDQYRRLLRAAVYGYLVDVLDYEQYFDAMMPAVRRGFTDAWHTGAQRAGIKPSEMSAEERMQLQRLIYEEYGFIDGLGSYVDALRAGVESGQTKKSTARAAAYTRVELWVNRWNQIENQAFLSATTDQKLKWVRTAQESCTSCIKLDGKIKRASFWKRVDLHPQSPRLECMRGAGGVDVCKCYFEQTEEALSRGPLPRI